MGVKKDDIISFEMVVKLTYKNCEVTVKRYGKILDLTIVNISDKGYIIEKNKTFINKSKYTEILICINKNISYIKEIYNELIEEGTRNDSNIRDFEEYEK